MARINGTGGDDFIHTADDGRMPPPGSNDIAAASDATDVIRGLRGDDTIFGGDGNDIVRYQLFAGDADQIALGRGSDVVDVRADDPTEVRLTFTSAEVGNGRSRDSGTLANQDGGLAVRLQAEDGSDGLVGPLVRTDDEGITFVGGDGITFDVRDLVSGVQRGNAFTVVTLGTAAGDDLASLVASRSYYINGGGGNDRITGGDRDDFLVGGAGSDALFGGNQDDSLLGGGGDDRLRGMAGDDTAIFNVTTDGADAIQLGDGRDVVSVSAATATQVRLTFTSAEVGNGSVRDANTLANQDGGLAVRLQAEDGSDGLIGPVTRVDDEGITFTAGAGVTFDVRDLVSGAQRGNQFTVVSLGTADGDRLEASDGRTTYINAGMGADTVKGADAADFLVGGAGADTLAGGAGNDSYVADATDTVRERADGGTDLVLSAATFSLRSADNVENLTLSGTAAADATGNRLANVVVGNAGVNALDGGRGSDSLTGNAGADSFVFSTRLGADNVDALTDFLSGTDTITLDNDVFRGLDAGALGEEAFTTNPLLLDADDRIVFDALTGTLAFDRDGSGDRFDAVDFATVGLGTAVDADDFRIV